MPNNTTERTWHSWVKRERKSAQKNAKNMCLRMNEDTTQRATGDTLILPNLDSLSIKSKTIKISSNAFELSRPAAQNTLESFGVTKKHRKKQIVCWQGCGAFKLILAWLDAPKECEHSVPITDWNEGVANYAWDGQLRLALLRCCFLFKKKSSSSVTGTGWCC